MSDAELSKKKVGQINFNTFANSNCKEIQKGIYADSETGNIINDMITFWNVDIAKSYKTVYNNIENLKNIPKSIRWGAILYSKIEDIELIKKIIGDDLLNMKEKRKLIERIKDVNDNDRIVKEWMVEANNKLREKGIIDTAREEGIEQGLVQGIEESKKEVIINMLNKNIDYKTISEVTGKTVEEIKNIENNSH